MHEVLKLYYRDKKIELLILKYNTNLNNTNWVVMKTVHDLCI